MSPMHIIDDSEVDRRLSNWVRWKCGERGGMGHAAHPLGRLADMVVDRWRYKETSIPLFAHEARQTDEDIQALPVPFRDALLEQHLGRGNVAASLARLGVARATFYERIKRARAALWTVWQARDQASRALRRANDEATRRARPQ